MFNKEVYVQRRNDLKKSFQSGVLFFPGNNEIPMNYEANPYHFRQDSSFLYFFGVDKPGFYGVMDLDRGREYLFGYDFTLDDIIWMGDQPKVKDLAARSGIEDSGSLPDLAAMMADWREKGTRIHYLPQYHAGNKIEMEEWLGISARQVNEHASTDLIRAVVALRSVKSELEVEEIKKALDISYQMYDTVYRNIRPGMYEYQLWGQLEGVPLSHNSHISFPTIMSVRGETLHNHSHGNRMEEGDLMIIDSGAESPEHYASDITRTFPVSGKFTSRQRDIYSTVLAAQKASIEMIRPGIPYRDVHLKAARIIAEGLKDCGLLKGAVDDIIEQGAHALYFPHGLGHMMGLDVHDMENLGEDHVGYGDGYQRSSQFGLAALRLAKELKPGYVLTVEPGIYFIPHLIEQWQGESRLSQWIDYQKAREYVGFGGIRIEDDVLVTEKGPEVLGRPIPKEMDDLERIIG